MNFTSWLGILLLIGALVAADLEHATHGAASAKFRVDHEAKGEHNTHADHKAVLGSKKSVDEFDDLPIDESKRRLGIIAKQMDKNKDGFVDSDELTDWIHASMISLDKEETEERFAEMDQDRDGFVTWDEYMFEAFGDEQTPLDVREVHARSGQMNEDDRRLVEEDSHYFKAADRDGDGRISTEEFDHFQNPEHYNDMHRTLVEMTMLEKDINKDGKIDLNEFLGNISENSALEWYQVEKNHFEEKYDTDKNGILEGDEVTKWLVPNLDETARQIPRWLREFNEKRNISASDAQIGYHFHIMRREFDFLGVSSLPSERFPHIVYVIGGRSFHFNASISSKADFMEFLEEHEEFSSDQIDDEHQLEQFINNAQSCQPVLQLLLIYDPERCPIPHFDNVVRGLRFTTNYSFSELLYPLDGETKVELLRRLDELPSICQLLVIMQNNGYVWTSADKNSQEMRSTIETLENKDCTMLAPGWLPIGRALTDIEKVFMREEDLSSDLQWSPGCIMVGATGGIAVVALAISIFWGLNGSSFVTK